MDLEGRTALVTGSGSGIGRAVALEFARKGANVVCCGRREERLLETLDLIEQEGGRGMAVRADVTQWAEVEAMAARARERFGAVAVLYNNAGRFQAVGALWEVDPESWWGDVTVNLLGTMLCCRAVLPQMMERDEGIIINMSGGGAERAMPGGSGYGCSKAAVLRLTEGIARECERASSRVLAFSMNPGFVRTEMTEPLIHDAEGRRWFPWCEQMVRSGTDHPPEDCARASVRLIRVACLEISGRAFDVETDFDEVMRLGRGQ